MIATGSAWAAWIAAGGAVLAAIIAGFFAGRAGSAQVAAQKIRDLEARLATSRLEAYKPMIESLGALFYAATPAGGGTAGGGSSDQAQQDFLDAQATFTTWVQMYGSDEAVVSYHKLMQALFVQAPQQVVFRLFADFTVAARRDLGDPDTKVKPSALLGTRITDLYQSGVADELDGPEEEVFLKHGWTPPWGDRYRS